MSGDNFVERVDAYSKGLIGLETENQERVEEKPRITLEATDSLLIT